MREFLPPYHDELPLSLTRPWRYIVVPERTLFTIPSYVFIALDLSVVSFRGSPCRLGTDGLICFPPSMLFGV